MLLDLSNSKLQSLEDCDIILEKLIELNLDYPSITYLNVSHNNIKSIKGLRAFENLRVLNISHNEVISLDDDYIPYCTEKIIADHNLLTDICFKGIEKVEEEYDEDICEENDTFDKYNYENGYKDDDDINCNNNFCCDEDDNILCEKDIIKKKTNDYKNKDIKYDNNNYQNGEEKRNHHNNNRDKKKLTRNRSIYDSFNTNLLNDKNMYTNKKLPLNKLIYLDVSYNNIKKLTTFEKYLHIINKNKREKNDSCSDDAYMNNFISNKTEQDVMILFFNSLETLHLRGNQLTNLKGLSVFKNLKVLDLRSNFINHPVQLFYILDNKNWLKKYQKNKMERKDTNYYSYFVYILKKYKNFKNLQNLFLQGNNKVLKPKYLFMSVYNVLKNINVKRKLSTDVITDNLSLDVSTTNKQKKNYMHNGESSDERNQDASYMNYEDEEQNDEGEDEEEQNDEGEDEEEQNDEAEDEEEQNDEAEDEDFIENYSLNTKNKKKGTELNNRLEENETYDYKIKENKVDDHNINEYKDNINNYPNDRDEEESFYEDDSSNEYTYIMEKMGISSNKINKLENNKNTNNYLSERTHEEREVYDDTSQDNGESNLNRSSKYSPLYNEDDTEIESNEEKGYGGDKNKYCGEKNNYGDEKNNYGGDKNKYGGDKNKYCDDINKYCDDKNNYGDSNYCDDKEYNEEKKNVQEKDKSLSIKNNLNNKNLYSFKTRENKILYSTNDDEDEKKIDDLIKHISYSVSRNSSNIMSSENSCKKNQTCIKVKSCDHNKREFVWDNGQTEENHVRNENKERDNIKKKFLNTKDENYISKVSNVSYVEKEYNCKKNLYKYIKSDDNINKYLLKEKKNISSLSRRHNEKCLNEKINNRNTNDNININNENNILFNTKERYTYTKHCHKNDSENNKIKKNKMGITMNSLDKTYKQNEGTNICFSSVFKKNKKTNDVLKEILYKNRDLDKSTLTNFSSIEESDMFDSDCEEMMRTSNCGDINDNMEDNNKEDINMDDRNKEDVNMDDRNKEDINMDDRNKEDVNMDDRNKEDVNMDDSNKDDINMDDRNKEDVNMDDRNKEDINMDDSNKDDINMDDHKIHNCNIKELSNFSYKNHLSSKQKGNSNPLTISYGKEAKDKMDNHIKMIGTIEKMIEYKNSKEKVIIDNSDICISKKENVQGIFNEEKKKKQRKNQDTNENTNKVTHGDKDKYKIEDSLYNDEENKEVCNILNISYKQNKTNFCDDKNLKIEKCNIQRNIKSEINKSCSNKDICIYKHEEENGNITYKCNHKNKLPMSNPQNRKLYHVCSSFKSESTDVTERTTHMDKKLIIKKNILNNDSLNINSMKNINDLIISKNMMNNIQVYPIQIENNKETKNWNKEKEQDPNISSMIKDTLLVERRVSKNEEVNDYINEKKNESSINRNNESPNNHKGTCIKKVQDMNILNNTEKYNDKDSMLCNNLALYLKDVYLNWGKEKQYTYNLLEEKKKLENEIKIMNTQKDIYKKKIKNLEKLCIEKNKITKKYKNMNNILKSFEHMKIKVPKDDMHSQNEYIENTMEKLYNVFFDAFGEEHIITKMIESLADVYIKKEKNTEMKMIEHRKELDLLKNVEEIVKKKDQYYNELLKKNEIIKSLNINLNNITKSVADMKKGIIENENKSKALLVELSKKDSMLKDMEKRIIIMKGKEKEFEIERDKIMELLRDNDGNVKSIKEYKDEVKALEEKLKIYIDKSKNKMNDKNYEKMVDKLHAEQIKIHSLLTEKEKIINEKNIQIDHLENQLQSWADEATNWVVLADTHAKLITKYNILKKNYEELKFKYIMDMKYIQSNKNEKVKELIKRFS
ncbi:leucine-rich repeat protein, putative [Plasmodium sp. DRC-Itaito]|nr:leucine-rich repeat protein, putative [Plasmodium sp. DRC-Itaito]